MKKKFKLTASARAWAKAIAKTLGVKPRELWEMRWSEFNHRCRELGLEPSFAPKSPRKKRR